MRDCASLIPYERRIQRKFFVSWLMRNICISLLDVSSRCMSSSRGLIFSAVIHEIPNSLSGPPARCEPFTAVKPQVSVPRRGNLTPRESGPPIPVALFRWSIMLALGGHISGGRPLTCAVSVASSAAVSYRPVCVSLALMLLCGLFALAAASAPSLPSLPLDRARCRLRLLGSWLSPSSGRFPRSHRPPGFGASLRLSLDGDSLLRREAVIACHFVGEMPAPALGSFQSTFLPCCGDAAVP